MALIETEGVAGRGTGLLVCPAVGMKGDGVVVALALVVAVVVVVVGVVGFALVADGVPLGAAVGVDADVADVVVLKPMGCLGGMGPGMAMVVGLVGLGNEALVMAGGAVVEFDGVADEGGWMFEGDGDDAFEEEGTAVLAGVGGTGTDVGGGGGDEEEIAVAVGGGVDVVAVLAPPIRRFLIAAALDASVAGVLLAAVVAPPPPMVTGPAMACSGSLRLDDREVPMPITLPISIPKLFLAWVVPIAIINDSPNSSNGLLSMASKLLPALCNALLYMRLNCSSLWSTMPHMRFINSLRDTSTPFISSSGEMSAIGF